MGTGGEGPVDPSEGCELNDPGRTHERGVIGKSGETGGGDEPGEKYGRRRAASLCEAGELDLDLPVDAGINRSMYSRPYSCPIVRTASVTTDLTIGAAAK